MVLDDIDAELLEASRTQREAVLLVRRKVAIKQRGDDFIAVARDMIKEKVDADRASAVSLHRYGVL